MYTMERHSPTRGSFILKLMFNYIKCMNTFLYKKLKYYTNAQSPSTTMPSSNYLSSYSKIIPGVFFVIGFLKQSSLYFSIFPNFSIFL